ncbi:tripartite tricarboxylate transporter TctB family protein [Microbacterium tumbae]
MSETQAAAVDAVDQQGRGWVKALRAIFAALLAGVGGYLVIAAEGLGYLDRTGAPGPGFFPRWVGLLLVVLAIAWGISELRAPLSAQIEQDLDPRGWLRSARFLLALIAFVVLLIPLGYVISSLAFMLFLTFTVGRTRGRWWVNVLVSLAVSVGAHLLFVQGLGVTLPPSPIPFLAAVGL